GSSQATTYVIIAKLSPSLAYHTRRRFSSERKLTPATASFEALNARSSKPVPSFCAVPKRDVNATTSPMPARGRFPLAYRAIENCKAPTPSCFAKVIGGSPSKDSVMSTHPDGTVTSTPSNAIVRSVIGNPAYTGQATIVRGNYCAGSSRAE